ncbi:MAG: type II secretion system secretin GspD [Gammaproteobacteria bacterium]|nr:type II secretion system secretin GspD [Gammaproteobacteria bacterium]
MNKITLNKYILLVTLLILAPLTIFAPSSMADQHDGTSKDESLSLNFRNVDIAQFIESVATITGKNFLIDRRVTGRITIIASQPIARDSLYDVMLSVLQFYGFTAIPDGDIIKVIPFAEGQVLSPSYVDDERHGFITEIIKINSVAVGEVVAIIKPMLTPQARITPVGKSKSIMISDTQSSIDRAKNMIRRLDTVEVNEYEIIPLNNAEASEIIATVTAIFVANNPGLTLNLQADQRTNRVIISGSREVRRQIKKIISSLDIPLSGDANIKVIYLRYADAQSLANILTRLTSSEAFAALADNQAGTPAAQPAPANRPPAPQPSASASASASEVKSGIQADTGLNALIISGGSNFIAAVESIIRQLDVKKAQIIIEVIIAELTDGFTRELGVDWVYNSGGVGLTADLSGNVGRLANEATRVQAGVGIAQGGLFGAAYSGTVNDGWGALYKLLSTDSRSNIVATPYIVTLDNEEASFSAGENRPFVTGTVTSDTNQVTRNVERRNVGINLVVTPQVTAGDTVKLAISQEISNALDNSAGENADLGITTTERKISTNVQVRDGGLIILGGLVSSQQTETNSKVPGLGDIPFLGYLFRNQQSQLGKTNIMIFMRPRILHDEATIASISYGKYNSLRQSQLALPQYNSLLPKSSFPQLQDLRDIDLFTDYGKQPNLDNILKSKK